MLEKLGGSSVILPAHPVLIFPNLKDLGEDFLKENNLREEVKYHNNMVIGGRQASPVEVYYEVVMGEERLRLGGSFSKEKGEGYERGEGVYTGKGKLRGEEVELKVVREYLNRRHFAEKRENTPHCFLRPIIYDESWVRTRREDSSELWFLCWQDSHLVWNSTMSLSFNL
jgi:hypothetical protein